MAVHLFQQVMGGHASHQYVAIQKRNFETGCISHLYHSFRYEDFSDQGFDKSGPDWQALRREDDRLQATEFYALNFESTASPMNFHPICNLTQEVIFGAQRAQGLRNLSTYVLLSDEQEEVPPHLASLPLTPSRLIHTRRWNVVTRKQNDLILDLMLGLHAGLLIRNPYSTLTMPLELARMVVGLPTSCLAQSSNKSLLALSGDAAHWFTMSDVAGAISRKRGVSELKIRKKSKGVTTSRLN
jgi:hypothetical protein